MAKYKVIALSVGGNANKVYSLNDIVTEKNFPVDHAEKLVRLGFLEKISEDEIEENDKESSNDLGASSSDNGEGSDSGSSNPNDDEGPREYEDITGNEIKDFLKEKGVEFKSNASKKDVYKLYVDLFEEAAE